MPKLLIVQFRTNPVSATLEAECIAREVSVYATVSTVSALNTSLDWQDPQKILTDHAGVIFGGSGDFDFDGGRPLDDEVRKTSKLLLERLRPFCQYLFTHDIPTLGICFGHQLLGAFAGVTVHSDPKQRKTRSHEVTLLTSGADSKLFADVAATFKAQYAHKDVLSDVPAGAVLLAAGGEACQVSALRYQKNIYSTQFHPELTSVDMVDRMNRTPGYLPAGVLAEEIFEDSPEASKIVGNFAKLVQEREEN